MQLGPDQTALVTGGASGIGLGLARALSARGVRVVVADVDAAGAQAAAATLPNATAVALDVRDADAWQAAARAAGEIQLLCNCAGVFSFASFLDQPVGVWRLTMDVNVEGPFLGIRTFLPAMLASGKPGRIVNVASLAGLWPEAKMAGYTASKYALVGLSEALQLELARTAVGVSLVFPGPTRTNLGRSTRRLGERDGLFAPQPDAVDTPTALAANGMDPDAVGRAIAEGIAADAPYIVSHPDWKPMLEARVAALMAAFKGPAETGYADDPAVVEKMAGRMRAALGS